MTTKSPSPTPLPQVERVKPRNLYGISGYICGGYGTVIGPFGISGYIMRSDAVPCRVREMMSKTIGLYPGSFDPLTNGHLDIAKRAMKLCDQLTIAVVANPNKSSTFTAAERVALWKSVAPRLGKNIRVDSFEGLLVDYAHQTKASLIFRGLRAVADFEYEFQMALINRSLHPGIEVCFLVPSEKFIFLSSSAVKEVARLGGDVTGFVPPAVDKSLRHRFGKKG